MISMLLSTSIIHGIQKVRTVAKSEVGKRGRPRRSNVGVVPAVGPAPAPAAGCSRPGGGGCRGGAGGDAA